MQRIVLIIGFILCNSFAFSQKQDCTTYLERSDSIYASNPDSSYSLSCIAEKCALETGDTMTLARCYGSKGKYLLLKSMLEEAGTELNKAMEIYSNKHDTSGLAYILKLRSILLERVGNHDESVKLLEQSYRYYKLIKNYKSAYSSLLNLSSRYTLNGQLDKAQKCFDAMDSIKEFRGKKDEYYYNQNKGVLAIALKNYPEAEKYLLKAWHFAQDKKMIDSEATILMYLGKNNRSKGNLSDAEKFLKMSEKVSLDNALDHELEQAYEELILLYETMGDFKNAFLYQKVKEELSKKILNIERVNKIASLEKKLALSEKQKELDLEKLHTAEEQNKSKRLVLGLVGIGGVSVLLVFLFVRTRKLKNKIHEKNIIVEEKAAELSARQKEILDSIHYAKRIQRALLTPEFYIKKYLNDFFILYKPKDIVSGDFYWAVYYEDKLYLAVADCTGHGVPGAFMSMIGINLLNEIIIERKCSNPGLILDIMREEVIRNLNAEGAEEESRDGMDIVLCKIDLRTRKLDFAGANNALYVLHADTNELKEYKGNKMPVGKHMDAIDSFDKQSLQLNQGDILYLFTDGYPDQFGGSKGKKFKYKQLEELLHKNSQLPMELQRELLNLAFEEWKAGYEQVDDVCIIGIRL